MKKLLLVVLIMAFVAVPAFASVQNVKVSGSVNTTGLHRTNFDLGTDTESDETQNLIFTSTTLQVDADLIENVSATIGLINEREWTSEVTTGATNDEDTDIDINLAYVTLREMLYSPLTVVVGRQAFKYGNSFIVDTGSMAGRDSNINDVAEDLVKQNSADAVRLIFDYSPLTVELMWTKLAENTNTATDSAVDDMDLYGIYTTYELGDDMNSSVEGYFFARLNKETGPDDGTVSAAVDIGNKTDTIFIPGILVRTNPIEGLSLSAEYAHQGGTRATSTDASNQQKRDAHAAQFISSYLLPVPVLEDMYTVAGYAFTWTSGDSNINAVESDMPLETGENWTGWDPFYHNQGVGSIANSILWLTNDQIHKWFIQTHPAEDITIDASLSWCILDKQVDDASHLGLQQPDDGVGTAAIGNLGADNQRDLYKEWEIKATYAYTEDVEIGAQFNWFVPGEAFVGETAASAGSHDTATQGLVHLNVAF